MGSAGSFIGPTFSHSVCSICMIILSKTTTEYPRKMPTTPDEECTRLIKKNYR
jgi:hypothetical protein